MRRILFAATRVLRGSTSEDGLSDADESVGASEGVIPTDDFHEGDQENASAAPTTPPKPTLPAVADANAVVPTAPVAPPQSAGTAPLPTTPTRRRSSRLHKELRRIGASPDVMKSPVVPSSYNLRSRRRVAPSTRTDSVAMSRPAFLHKRDVENASTATLRAVCNRFGVSSTGNKEEMRARALAKMAEKTTDDFSARPTDEHGEPAPVTLDKECTDERANCLTTSTTKKNLANVNDPIVRGVGDVHGKSDVPDADVNLPPAPPQIPTESRPARSWVTDRSVVEKHVAQGPPPTPPLTIPRASLPPRGSPSSPINNPAESVDVSAPLNTGTIFQDWLRTNRRLTAAEYEACVQALRGSVSDGSSLRLPAVRAPIGATNLGVSMVPSAAVKRLPMRSATLGLPSPVASTAMRAGMPTTPGVRSSTSIPTFSRMEVTQPVPQNEGSHVDARGTHQNATAPVPNDVTSERNMHGSGRRDLPRRLQQSSQSMPVDTSSSVVRKGAEGAPNGERPFPSRFSGAVGGPSDHNIERSSIGRRHPETDKKPDKPRLDGDWMERLIGEKFKDEPMKENPEYGDMVQPQQLLNHFNESRPSKARTNDLDSGDVVKRNSAQKKIWELRPHPRETVARIRKRNQERARHREWQERLRTLDKEKREEARRSLYEKKPIESETGGELIDVRNALNQKKTRYELAQIRERLQRPVSPPLPPRARRALRFLKALKEDTSHLQTEVRKPDSLPPLPPRLKKVRVKGGFTGTTSMFGNDSSSESSVDYERPPDEIILWKRLKRRQQREDRKLKEKKARERKNVAMGGESPTKDDMDINVRNAATVPAGKEQAAENELNSHTHSASKSADLVNASAKDNEKHQASSVLTSVPGNKLKVSPSETSNPFETKNNLSPAGFNVPLVSPSLFGTGKVSFGSSIQPAAKESNDELGKSSDLLLQDASKPAEPRFSEIKPGGEEKGDSAIDKPRATGMFGFRSSLDDGAKAKFDFGKLKEQTKKEHERKPELNNGDKKPGLQRKRKMEDVESPLKSAVAIAANEPSTTTSLFPVQGQGESEERNVKEGAKGDMEPTGSNGKTSAPSLPASTVPALANSSSPPARSGKDPPVEEAIHAAEIPPEAGGVIRTRTDHDGGQETDGAQNGQDGDKQALETSLFRVTENAPVVFGKEALTAAKPKESLKHGNANFGGFLSNPADAHPSKDEEETTQPTSLIFAPSKPKEESKGLFAVPNERKTEFANLGKGLGPSVFTSSSAASFAGQTPSDQPEQNPSVVKPVNGTEIPTVAEGHPDTEDKKPDAPNPRSTKAQEPFTFGAANPFTKGPFESPSFGSQITTGNPFGLKRAGPLSEKAAEDAMATNGAPTDRKDSKPLFAIESKGSSAQGTPFGGFNAASATPTPGFGSIQTETPSAPFSFTKSVGNGQKQPGGPFGDSKFRSALKSTGPASSFVFGASKPSEDAKPSNVAPTLFSADASKSQTAPTKPNPFATPNSSSFATAPTGFGTSSQSQGFSFSGGSSAFGSSNPVDKPSSFGAPNFGNTNNTGFGQGASKPAFSFGAAAAGGPASAFVAPSGNAAPSPFDAPNPSQSAFGAQPFGSQQESRPLFGAPPSAPFSQSNPFGASNNNTQPGLGGHANEAPGSNNAFSAQGGQPSGAGAFAMGSTSAPRRKVKARRMLR